MDVRPRPTRRVIPWIALVVSVPFWSAGSRAQGPWVPFVAQRLAKVYQLNAGGKKLIAEQSGVWLRNGQGSIYMRNTPLLGNLPAAAAETATLTDGTTGTAYLIDYASKTVRMKRKGQPRKLPTSASFHSRMPQDRFIGRKTIDGIECEGYRMLWSMGAPSPDSGQDAGEMWVAPSLNFAPLDMVIMHDEIEREIDVDVVSISPGQEPDRALFRIPPVGFTLLR